MNATTKKIIRIYTLPGILPRIKDFFGSGFASLSLFIASVFQVVRLLPENHPYLNPSNMGRFGIRHVILEAWRNLSFKWVNSDQVIIFFAILLGIIMLFFQFGMFVFALSIEAAHAGGLGSFYASFFVTQNPAEDIAFITLDRVFGIPDMFDSRVDNGSDGPFPTPFHTAMHTLFEFYSIGVFIVGIILVIYFTMALTSETAVSGIPFGKRFNPWTGIRFILAIAFLAPIFLGLNMAQLTILRLAKWGSSAATNGWIVFNNELTGSTLGGDPRELVSIPNEPDVNTLLEFMYVVHACRVAQDKMYNRTIEAYLVHEDDAALDFNATGFNAALTFTNNNNITIRFGEEDATAYPLEESNVRGFCGELTFPIQDVEEDGALSIQEDYYDFISTLWNDALLDANANQLALRILPTLDHNPFATQPPASFYTQTQQDYVDMITQAIQDAVNAQIASGKWFEDMTLRGWAGAAIFYNKIAQLNGGLIAAAKNLPTPSFYPEIMEQVRDRRQESDESISGKDRFKPYLADGSMVDFDMPQDMYVAIMLHYAQSVWTDRSVMRPTTNPFIDTINMIFGTQGLFDIVENTDIHPLAQIVAVGRGLIESSLINLGFAAGGMVLGGIGSLFSNNTVKIVGQVVTDFAGKIAMVAFALGFILFYVVPFMPFIYFFFAVGSWVKSIFEAMVGLPLWALSLIRIDGDGPPGPSGMNGIWLAFEIFLRPMLILFGFLAAITIFVAQVKVLNEIWYLVISNLTGHDNNAAATAAAGDPGSIEFYRHPIDQFFYTIVYTIIVYLAGIASFKLIDAIPNQMLRWMGQSVSSFQDHTGDPGQNLVRNIYAGINAATGQFSGALTGLMGRN